MLKFLLIAIFFTSTLLLSSCNKDENIPGIPPAPFNYLPLENGTKWTYLLKKTSLGDSPQHTYDTVSRYVAKDTIVNTKSYKLINNDFGFSQELVRNENGDFFSIFFEGASLVNFEWLIMKNHVKPGDTWDSHPPGDYHYHVTVVEIKPSETINGKNYENVVVIKKDYGEHSNQQTSYHHFVNYVGEIYTYLPYPLSGRFEHIELSLISIE